MDETKSDGVYGIPPAELAAVPTDATQYSPLIPGAQSLETCAEGAFASLTVLAPPGTLERRYTLVLGLKALAPEGRMIVLAPKDKGGSRLRKELEAFGCSVTEGARRHYRICHAGRAEAITGLDEAIAAGAMRYVEDLGLWSQPGIFSWDRLDPGTALLLEYLPAFSGRGADLGCGLGTLARAILASSGVTQLTLLDIDRRAVEAARRNVTDARAHVLWADVRVSGVGEGGLDFIVMNPPFHDGGTEDRALGQNFIRRAAEALRPGGVCWLVANRHLPYEAVMKPLFRRVTSRAEGSGYKIYEALK
ncbi:class I SAM-dependent methyltransferase [Microvirga puerhi]|uniref:Class I SAM-dependent methyltransferase n=1 Tax=Microvirga puerhi TaxID=2876078 RepID=A0ABS7VKJ3_9HYPH|nr:class I SAM-dependent methyltransferase [Microvirga puerhi]MBZ6076053.1 class I SAM-dependent methyltransferase [Microvirga puerhi]